MRILNLLSMRYVCFTFQLQVIISHVKGYKKIRRIMYPITYFIPCLVSSSNVLEGTRNL